jgi:hypothetical protein
MTSRQGPPRVHQGVVGRLLLDCCRTTELTDLLAFCHLAWPLALVLHATCERS